MRIDLFVRHINLRCLDKNEKDENRPLRFGLHDRVRLLPLGWRINRTIDSYEHNSRIAVEFIQWCIDQLDAETSV